MTLDSAQQFDLTALTVFTLAACLLFLSARCAVTFTRADVRKASIHFRSQLGEIGWDYTQSFATSTGVIGSVLTLILTSGALPAKAPTHILPPGAYAGLAVFFGTLVIIAPILYNGTTTRVNVSAASERDTGYEYRGRVWGFLVAALVTQWGLLGSISTVFVALLELYDVGDLPALPVGLLGGILCVCVLAFARYCWLKIDGTIRDQCGLSGAEARPGQRAMATLDAAGTRAAAAAPARRKPPVTLL